MTNNSEKLGPTNDSGDISNAKSIGGGHDSLVQLSTDQIKSNLVKRVASNGWFTVVAALASIISVPASIYFYIESKEAVDLRYSINKTRTTVVKAGQTSKLKASFNGNPLISDVSAVQLSLTNQGKRSIKFSDILKPVTVRIPDGKILESTIAKESRDVIKARLVHQSEEATEIVWDILEKNDFIEIQIIYSGTIEIPLKVFAVVEGQREIAEDNSEAETRRKTRIALATLIMVGLVSGLTLSTLLAMGAERKRYGINLGRSFWINLLLFFGCVFFWVYIATKVPL